MKPPHSVLLIIAFVSLAVCQLGCGTESPRRTPTQDDYVYPDTPVVTDSIPGTIAWDVQDLVMHEYALHSTDRLCVYYFTRFSTIMSAFGSKDDPDSVTYPYLHWKLDNRGCVLISDDADGDVHTTLALVSISKNEAQVLNVGTGEHETHKRRMTD